jgi:predicted nucleic acid-binding protein
MPPKTEAEVDRLVDTGVITAEMAKIMKSSMSKVKAAPPTSEADVDRLVDTGVITAEMAALMKASIITAKAKATPAAAPTSEADVDRLVATGVITAEMATLMKSSMSKVKAAPPTSEADVDRLVDTGVITAELAKLMKSSMSKVLTSEAEAKAPPTSEAEVYTGVITAEMANPPMSDGPVHILVDFSNFWWPLTRLLASNDDKTLQKHRASYDGACDKVFESLSNSVLGHYVAHRIKTALCVGSVPPGEDRFWDLLKAHKFTVSLNLRATDEHGKNHENATDATLHAQILAELCDLDKNPVDGTKPAAWPTLVLLTGDGNANEGLVKSGFTKPTTFPMCVQRALRMGWHVKQYAWSWSCNRYFKELRHARYELVFLDDCKAFAEQFDFKTLCKKLPSCGGCKWFKTPEGCKNGDKCKFSHDSAVAP